MLLQTHLPVLSGNHGVLAASLQAVMVPHLWSAFGGRFSARGDGLRSPTGLAVAAFFPYPWARPLLIHSPLQGGKKESRVRDFCPTPPQINLLGLIQREKRVSWEGKTWILSSIWIGWNAVTSAANAVNLNKATFFFFLQKTEQLVFDSETDRVTN